MSLVLYAGWNHNVVGTATIGWVDSGPHTASVTGTHAHVDLISILGAGNYTIFRTALDTVMDVESAGNTITFDLTTFTYKLVRGTLWTIQTTTNTLMRNILGLPLDDADYPLVSVDEGGGVFSISSTRRPHYLLNFALGGKSQFSDDIEPEGIAATAMSDGGLQFGITRTEVAVSQDFVIPMESHEATFARVATAAVPWTFQHFVQHARVVEPFGILASSPAALEVCKLRIESASFRPRRVVEDHDSLWDWPFAVNLLGRS